MDQIFLSQPSPQLRGRNDPINGVNNCGFLSQVHDVSEDTL